MNTYLVFFRLTRHGIKPVSTVLGADPLSFVRFRFVNEREVIISYFLIVDTTVKFEHFQGFSIDSFDVAIII